MKLLSTTYKKIPQKFKMYQDSDERVQAYKETIKRHLRNKSVTSGGSRNIRSILQSAGSASTYLVNVSTDTSKAMLSSRFKLDVQTYQRQKTQRYLDEDLSGKLVTDRDETT
jgi:hypothetical protein